jgi:hypothetical protein
LTERLDKVAVRAQPHVVASVDGMYLGDRHRRRTACNAGRHPLGTADGLQRLKLILERRDGVHRAISFPMRPTPAKAAAACIRCGSHGVRAALSRIQQAIVKLATLHLVFSNLWRWRSAVINTARSSTVIATRCSLMRPRTQI